MEFSGKGVALLANEAGLHRIQHIPATERRGRTHTSSLTVAVLDASAGSAAQAGAPERHRAPSDFRVSWFSGTGPGGQNRNKVQASARVEHLPTGRVRTAQTRSRKASLASAMAALVADLDAMAKGTSAGAMQAARRQQTDPGATRRRTWRFQDDRVVDHLSGRAASCTRVLRGAFADLWPSIQVPVGFVNNQLTPSAHPGP